MANSGGMFVMAGGIPVRDDYLATDLRVFARRSRDAGQARRLIAIAAVLDGASRSHAAEIGGMDRQTLRDWVVRFNDEGPQGLINRTSPGAPPKLEAEHKAALAELVERGPDPAVDAVVRWRDVDLVAWVTKEFGIQVSDDTIYRTLHELGYSHISARPRAYAQDDKAMEDFKKTSPPSWQKSVPISRRERGSRSGSRMRCGSARKTS